MEQLRQELAKVKQENNTLTDDLERKQEYIQELERINWQLRQQLQTASASLAPDYEATRDRTLAKLKVGKQSTVGKAIDAFIKEIMRE